MDLGEGLEEYVTISYARQAGKTKRLLTKELPDIMNFKRRVK